MSMRSLPARLATRLRTPTYWLIAQVALTIMRLLRLMPVDRALNLADRVARRIGPLSGRHRVALDNLRKAFPEKDEAEIRAIALGMWGNMAKLAAEYIFLDRLFDYDTATRRGERVEVFGEEHFLTIASEPKPHIIFTAHLGNFELLPVAGASLGMKVTSLFRPPNNPYLARHLYSTRSAAMGGLQPSRSGAAIALARILEDNGNIGLLVDQKFNHGIPATFFGRACENSPLLPRLARQYDCDVYPARSTRLPGNRFRLQIYDKITLPRDAEGRIDAAATSQLLNDIVEGWIRETPDQWMWFHKRWSSAGLRRRD